MNHYFKFKTHKKYYHPEKDATEIQHLDAIGFKFSPPMKGKKYGLVEILNNPEKNFGNLGNAVNLVNLIDHFKENGELILSRDVNNVLWLEIYNP